MRSGKAAAVSAISTPGRKGVQHLAFLSSRALSPVTLLCMTSREEKVDSQQYCGPCLRFISEQRDFFLLTMNVFYQYFFL